MKKRIPKFKSDKQLEKFIDRDLTEYIRDGKFASMTFEFSPKSKVVNLRMSDELLEAVKKASNRRKIPYQRYIREALEISLRNE